MGSQDVLPLNLIALPLGEGGPRQWRSGALVYRRLEMHFLALFHTASTLSAPSGHLPLEGKAKKERRFAPISIHGEASTTSLNAGIRS